MIRSRSISALRWLRPEGTQNLFSTRGFSAEAENARPQEVKAIKTGYNVAHKKAYEQKMKELRKVFIEEREEREARLLKEQQLEDERMAREVAIRRADKAMRSKENMDRAQRARQQWYEQRTSIQKMKEMKRTIIRDLVNVQRARVIYQMEIESDSWITPDNMDEIISEDLFMNESNDLGPNLSQSENDGLDMDFSDFKLGDNSPFSKPFSLLSNENEVTSEDSDLFALSASDSEDQTSSDEED